MFGSGNDSEGGGGARVVESQMERTARLADDRFNELMGVLNATTARLVEVVGEFLDAGTWKGPEVRSAAHFVTWRLGVSRARANDLVAMARRRGELPACTAVFASGLITEDAMGVIARHLPAERDAEVAELAQQVTVPQLARILGTLPRPEPHPDDPEPPEPDDDVRLWRKRNGRLGLAGDISAERGAVVQKALEAARDAEFRDRHPEAHEGATPTDVTWVDAMERLAYDGLGALDPATAAGRPPSDRYQVLIHLNEADLDGGLQAHLHLGPALSEAARREIGCDCTLRWVLERYGRPLAWGQRQRVVDPVLRALIEDRDGGCRVPACGQRRWLRIHHIRHSEDGGLTVPENLVALCGAHHRLHHQGLLGISGDPTRPDGLIFTNRHGWRLTPAATPTPPERPPPQAAAEAGVRYCEWQPSANDPLNLRWITWN